MKKSALRLPKLKTRNELLRTAPELGRFLAAGDETSGTVPALAGPKRAASPLIKPRSPGIKARAGSPQRVGRISDEEITEEDRVRAELEHVKAERAALLGSLAKLRNDAGKSGGELQQEDIRLLRRELEVKKEKLNELRRATTALDDTLAQLETTSRDCEQLMPDGEEALQARVAQLSSELAAVEQDILEAEAKHELYKLLETRTRRDHAASEQRMRESRALKEGAADDYTTLVKQMHEMRAAKEDAERELGGVVGMYDQVRGDWSKKLRDRRKEVRELEKRKAEDEQRRQQQAAIAAEKALIEQDKSARTQCERDAATARLSAVVPQLEALEATWARLHGICGASNAEELIVYWKELKAKEASMRELVRLAEVREARAKQEMAALLAERAEVFDTKTARGERHSTGLGPAAEQNGALPLQQQEQGGQVGAAAAEEQQEGQAEAEAGTQEATAAGETSPRESSAGSTQGSAGAEVSPVNEGATAADSPAAAAAATPEAAVEHVLREKQLAVAEARRRKAAAHEKFSKLSQVCVAADQGLRLLSSRLRAALEASTTAEAARRRSSRTTGTGVGSRHVTSLHRRTTGQHLVRRISAASLKEHRSSFQILPAPDLGTPRELPAASGTSIYDREFFPELPATLTDVSSRLGNLMSKIEQLETASAAASEAAAAAAQRGVATAAPDALGEGSSSLAASEASEAAPGSTSWRSPSKKLQWADGQGPAADRSGAPCAAGEGDDGEGEGEGGAGSPATEGEKALRKGFRRRTLAGPAWLDAVGAGKPLTASLLRKQPGSRGGAALGVGAAALQRIVGYAEEPGSSGEEGGAVRREANPFDLGSSEDELDGEGEAVVDRQYLKHRAHKLTNPKARAKRSGVGGSATSPTVQGH